MWILHQWRSFASLCVPLHLCALSHFWGMMTHGAPPAKASSWYVHILEWINNTCCSLVNNPRAARSICLSAIKLNRCRWSISRICLTVHMLELMGFPLQSLLQWRSFASLCAFTLCTFPFLRDDTWCYSKYWTIGFCTHGAPPANAGLLAFAVYLFFALRNKALWFNHSVLRWFDAL
jgi:hypothetical protein